MVDSFEGSEEEEEHVLLETTPENMPSAPLFDGKALFTAPSSMLSMSDRLGGDAGCRDGVRRSSSSLSELSFSCDWLIRTKMTTAH